MGIDFVFGIRVDKIKLYSYQCLDLVQVFSDCIRPDHAHLARFVRARAATFGIHVGASTIHQLMYHILPAHMRRHRTSGESQYIRLWTKGTFAVLSLGRDGMGRSRFLSWFNVPWSMRSACRQAR